MNICVEKIDWEKTMTEHDIVKDCLKCEWYKNHVCKAQPPCLSEKLQCLKDSIDNLISKQKELENKQDRIIRGLQGKADAECKCSGGL